MKFGFVVLLIFGLFIAGCTQPTTPQPKQTYLCPDGSIVTQISDCPKAIQTYSCPDGSVVTDMSSCPKQTCPDGTDYGSCSNLKPMFCQNGQWIPNASACGCSSGYDISGDNCVPHVNTCSDGTMYDACSLTKPKYCSNLGLLIDDASTCGCPSDYDTSGNGCTLHISSNTNSYSFTSYENTEPYYSAFCDKIDPYDLSVRKAAADAIRTDPGSYSVSQLFDIYDWVIQKIFYQNSPLAGTPFPPSETLTTASGDCKNQAVLIASMVQAIGGTAEVVADPTCSHAYAVVYYGPSGSDMSSFTQAVANHYGSSVNVHYFTHNNGFWIIFDPVGGAYPGDTMPECSGSEDRYFIKSCLECVHQFSNEPYTYGDRCYSQCPSGTITANKYACQPCSKGSYSCNDQCLTCPSGYYMATNCRCYKS